MNDEQIIEKALHILREKAPNEYFAVGSPDDSKKYAQLKIGSSDREIFLVMFLNAAHKVIAYEEMFKGTLDKAAIYPREIAKAALKHNAAAVILAHNHPSGSVEPSDSDQTMTKIVTKALALLDIIVLDHLIVSYTDTLSFAERGLI